MRRGAYFMLGGVIAVSCALPDVSIVNSFGDAGRGGAGTGGTGTGGSAGATGKGGTSGRGTGGAAAQGGTGAGAGGDSGEAGEGDGASGRGVGGSGQTGGTAGNGGKAGGGGIGGAGGGGAGMSSGGASAGMTTSGAIGGGGAGGIAGTGGNGSPTCGDGTHDPGEACDDGNISACGTCAADCLTATPLAPARGTIQVTAGAVVDGEKFTLDDGFGAVDFEFDDDMTWTAGVPRVGFTAASSANEIRDAIIGAVNNPNNGLAITAYADSAEGQISLVNDNDWGAGNRPITDQVNNPAFTHTGMSGGAGRDCLGGVGCTTADVCDESFTCTLGVCSPP